MFYSAEQLYRFRQLDDMPRGTVAGRFLTLCVRHITNQGTAISLAAHITSSVPTHSQPSRSGRRLERTL